MKPEPVKPDRSVLDDALARLEAKRAKVDAERGVKVDRPACPRCDGTGWEPVGTTGQANARPVRRCRNGCEVPANNVTRRRDRAAAEKAEPEPLRDERY